MGSFWIWTEREGQDGGAKDEALVSSLGNWAGGLGGNGRKVSSEDGGEVGRSGKNKITQYTT